MSAASTCDRSYSGRRVGRRRCPDACPDFLVQVTARQLRLGDAPFSNLAGTVDRRSGIWQSAKLSANIEDSQVSLDIDTPTRQTAAILRGSDAGWLIRGFASSDNGIRGGTFRLSADLTQTSGAVSGSGDLKIRNFTLWGAPTIARIISLASFSGLSNALSGRGVPVTRLVVPFRLQARRADPRAGAPGRAATSARAPTGPSISAATG